MSRNADDFELSQVLDLFVDPVPELEDPFGYENSIVKGRMGSGKTMFLRANLAYHLFGLVPSLIEGESPVVRILIKLNDLQHIKDPDEIYKSVIVKVIEGVVKVL